MITSTTFRPGLNPLLRLAAAALMLIPFLNSSAEYSEQYYSRMDGKKKEALKQAAKECVQNHTRLDYYNLPNQWQYSDVYPELYNGCKRWWEMYSNEVFLIEPGQSALKSYSANKMQREHSVPKSWWKKNGDVEYTPAYSDMWNLYPSDGTANQRKSNYPLGVVATASFDNGSCKVGGAKTGYGGGSASVFEPADEYKGDFARSFFYMATVYDDLPWVYTYMFKTETWPTLQPWAYNMLLQWARQDPVSQKEIVRNNSVDNSQGNRNPFVDFPELAEYIWGTRTSETFYIADQGGQITPPITGDPELSAPINGSALDFGQAAVDAPVTAYLEFVGKNFTDPISLRVSGSDKAMFRLSESSITPSAVNTSSSYLLPIVFTPTSTGLKEATLIIYDGGLDGSISVTLRGEGCPKPALSTLTALDATEVTDNSYVANWRPAPDSETVDYYVINRVRYTATGTESETIQAGESGVLVSDREPDVMETYTVQSCRLGYLSEESNTIFVAANGVAGVTMDAPMVIGTVDGGFGIISNPASDPISVYDMSGTVIGTYENLQNGDTVILPRGIYLVTSPSLSKPVKILVY
ncbi:MAG: endonuclease [Muribaculum sp.]|nr:endonuclease [Muribaculum sp.]